MSRFKRTKTAKKRRRKVDRSKSKRDIALESSVANDVNIPVPDVPVAVKPPEKQHNCGRPTKWTPDVPKIVLSMMAQGCSKVEVAAQLGITMQTFWDWEQRFEGFAEVVELGVLLSQAWWERQGRLNIQNKDFNHSLFMMNMQNRFGWSRAVGGNPDAINLHKHVHLHGSSGGGGSAADDEDPGQFVFDAGTAAKVLEVLEDVGVIPQNVLDVSAREVADDETE